METTFDILHRAIIAHSSLDDKDIIEAFRRGTDIGWAGFTNTSDCVEFYEKNKDAIHYMLDEQAEVCGQSSIHAMVATSVCEKTSSLSEECKNILARYTLESVGLWLVVRKFTIDL